MPLPLSKTYYSDNNAAWAALDTSANMFKAMIHSIKEAIVGNILNTNAPAGTKWTVYYSCDGTTAGTANDGVDRLTTYANWVRASGAVAHSWIVLKSPVALGPLYLLIQYNGAADYNWKIYLSTAAFSGGSTTVAPTSTVSAQCEVTTFWNSSDTGAAAGKTSKTVDANGGFQLLLGKTGVGKAGVSVGLRTLTGYVSGDAVPVVLWVDVGTSTNPPLMAGQNNWRNPSTRAMTRNSLNTVACGASPLAPGYSNSAGSSFTDLLNGVDQADGKFIDFEVPVGIVQGSTTYSFKGILPDFRWAPYSSSSSTLAQNQMAEQPDGTPTHLLVGSTWCPWMSQPTW
jgi:hypothetical protein